MQKTGAERAGCGQVLSPLLILALDPQTVLFGGQAA